MDYSKGLEFNEIDSDILDELNKGIRIILKKYKDGSCIWWKTTLNKDILQTLELQQGVLYDIETKERLRWELLENIEIVDSEFIDNLPSLDKFICGGVKNCF
jgi:hypothetical protein